MIVNNRIIPGLGGIGNISPAGNQPSHNVTKPNSNFEDIFAKKLFENKDFYKKIKRPIKVAFFIND